MRRAPRPVQVTAAVATAVAVAALATAAVLRMQRAEIADAASAPATATSVENAADNCGERPCEVLTSVPVGPTTVELLADDEGHQGRLRFLDADGASLHSTALAGMGVRLTQKSLSCTKGSTNACLVRGGHNGGVVGEVFVARGGGWTAAEQPYFSNAGLVELAKVTGDDAPEVAVAQMPDCHGDSADCAGLPIVVEVFELDGSSQGCTTPYNGLTQLPGWPDITLSASDLKDCA